MQYHNQLTVAERIQYILSLILQTSLVIAIGYTLWRGYWHILFISSLAYFLTLLPAFISRNVRIHLPIEFELGLIGFVYAATFLGDGANFYARFWWWDVLLHSLSGVFFGFAGFIILYTLWVSGRLIAKPYLIAIFSCTFGLAIGALWEIFEFSTDSVIGSMMQHGSLRDTMWDIINDFLGAMLTALFGLLYLRKEAATRGFFHMLVQKFVARNPELVRLIERNL
ncbi:MAG: hypothetical protein WC817_01485 [Patescibacteria group bacterium]